MTKTAKEWFEQLPEPIRTQAVENWEKSNWSNKNDLFDSLADALNIWEWDKYWRNIVDRAERGEFDQPNPNLHGWIPVSERLPTAGEQVIVIGKKDTDLTDTGEIIEQSVGLVDFESIDRSQCSDICYYDMWYTNIKFWQPSPKLPEVRNV